MSYKSGKKTYLYLGAILALLIILHYLGWIAPLEKLIRSSTIPIIGQVHTLSVRVGDNYQFFKDRGTFLKAYEECSKNTGRLAKTEADIKILKIDNDELKKQLYYLKKGEIGSVLAEVVGKELLGNEQTIIINRGAEDGIKVDQPAIVGEGILIGKVIKTEKDISIIRLINDNQSRVGAAILNQNRSIGVVEGGFGISLRMTLIPRDEVVLVGDQVVSSGLESNVPRGLLIGSVAVVENEAYKPFQQAVLTPSTDLNKLTVVSVLSTSGPNYQSQ